MKPTYFRVQNKTKPDDFTDFDNIDDARKFCDEWALTEETHELQMWKPNESFKRDPVMVEISVFEFPGKPGVPAGAIFRKAGDENHLNLIMAISKL